MKIHQKLWLEFTCTSILVGLIGCNAIKTNSKTKSSALILSNAIEQEVLNARDILFAAQETQIAISKVLKIKNNSK